jgi:hypothetical protein
MQAIAAWIRQINTENHKTTLTSRRKPRDTAEVTNLRRLLREMATT